MIDAQYLRFIAGSKFSKDKLRNTLIDAADAMDAQAAEIARLREALKVANDALEEISNEMTVGDRWTNAGQSLLDALPVARAALAQQEQ